MWSGWVGIAQKTGFGLVSPLPGILPSLHLDTSITLPVGVEAYAAYALRAWLAGEHAISGRTRRFAKWSAICSSAGRAGEPSAARFSSARATLLAPISTDVTRGSRSAQASVICASDWPRDWRSTGIAGRSGGSASVACTWAVPTCR